MVKVTFQIVSFPAKASNLKTDKSHQNESEIKLTNATKNCRYFNRSELEKNLFTAKMRK